MVGEIILCVLAGLLFAFAQGPTEGTAQRVRAGLASAWQEYLVNTLCYSLAFIFLVEAVKIHI